MTTNTDGSVLSISDGKTINNFESFTLVHSKNN